MNDIRQLEHLTLQTSPAISEKHFDGWVLRASGTDTRRANSVTQLERGRLPLAEKVAFCEDWYREQKQPPIFRLTSAISDPDLDVLLASNGYKREGGTHIMTMPLAELPAERKDETAPLVERSVTEGIGDFHRLKGSSAALAQQDLKRQQQWDKPQAYFAVEREGEVVCSGLARSDGEYVGVFNMRTADHERGKGHATRLVGALLAWGARQGARQAFLQVEQSNVPALKVYRRFGFAPCYDYWYREPQ